MTSLATSTVVDIAAGLVEIPSLSRQESVAVTWLVEQMAMLGYDAHVDGAGNAVGSIGTGDREIMLLGHIDTVPGDVPVRIIDGVLHGRGAVDAKGPLATFVAAGARVLLPEGVRVTVIGAVGEESFGSPGATWLRDTRSAPDALIIGEPSGWDGVVLGYKGSVSLTATASCPSSHSAGPDPTAPELAFAFWQRLQQRLREHNGDTPDGFSTLNATLRSFNANSDGMIGVATLEITFRLPPGTTIAWVQEQVGLLAEGVDLYWEPNAEAYRTDKRSPLVAPFLAAIRAAGGTPKLKVKTGTSDMNVVGPVWSCPAVAYGPGDARYDHTPDEQIPLDDLEHGVTVLTAAIERIAQTLSVGAA